MATEAVASMGDAPRAHALTRRRTPTPGELAWLVAPPCALLMIVVVVVLGPAVGDVTTPPFHSHFWNQPDIRPEPTEHGRYLLAVLAPFVLTGCMALGAGRAPELPPATIRVLVIATQVLTLVLLGTFIAAQHIMSFGELITGTEASIKRVYFTIPTIVVAALVALLVCVVAANDRARAAVARLLGESTARRVACLALAVLFTAAWLLIAINSDATVGKAHYAVSGFILWSMEETFAVLNGRSPLVDFHAQYGSLWPYAAAGTMSLLGTTITVWSTFMASITLLALVGIYDVLRRVTRSSIAALALYAPFVASGFFQFLGPADNRYAPANLFSLFPVRYGGPYLLAWLLARHLDGVRPRRLWPLFLWGGLVMMNNLEFGISAVGAMVFALLVSGRIASWRDARAALGGAALGLLGAFALVSTLTLVRTGELPHLGLLLEYSRLYGVGGWAMLPMPRIGFHYAIYLTYVAAIALATVRRLNGQTGLLTGMLAWAGVFGLGVGAYYVGNSHPENLISMFSIWTFTLGLLTVAIVRAILARPSRRPTAAELAVLLALGLAVCSVAQTPTPWSQLRRLGETTPLPAPPVGYADRFIAPGNIAEIFTSASVEPGEEVVILFPLSHRIAYDLGIVNVSPYSHMEAVPTEEQLETVVETMRAHGARKLFFMITLPDPAAKLEELGMRLVRIDDATRMSEWHDTRAAGG